MTAGRANKQQAIANSDRDKGESAFTPQQAMPFAVHSEESRTVTISSCNLTVLQNAFTTLL